MFALLQNYIKCTRTQIKKYIHVYRKELQGFLYKTVLEIEYAPAEELSFFFLRKMALNQKLAVLPQVQYGPLEC